MRGTGDHVLPADICEQTESIRAKGTCMRSQLQLLQNGGIWTAEHISPSWLQQLWLQL